VIKLFSTFTGVGSPEMALKNIGVDFELVGMSEVDRYALIAYDAIHNDQEMEVEISSKEEMVEEFERCNIGYNFSTYKNEIPRGLKDVTKMYVAHKRNKNWGDIRKIDETKLPDFDMFTYSYPCKSVSIAGRQEGLKRGSGTQSSLLWECDRIIKHKLPTYLMMENVKNLVGKNHIQDFKDWISLLDSYEYNSYWSVLNGKHYGVPQNRERVIMISILKEHDNDNFHMPTNNSVDVSLKEILEGEVGEKYFINPDKYKHITDNLPNQEIDCYLDTHYYKGTSIEKKKRTLIQVGNIDDKKHANTRIYSEEGLSPTLNSMNGGNRQPKIMQAGRIVGRNPDNPKSREKGLPTVQILEINQNPDVTNTLSTVQKDNVVVGVASRGRRNENGVIKKQIETRKDNVSNSLITVKSDSMLYVNFKVRRLTPLECWRLMGYHDEDFEKTKEIGGLSNTKLYERAGRGIVVPMLEAVFTNLFKPLDK